VVVSGGGHKRGGAVMTAAKLCSRPASAIPDRHQQTDLVANLDPRRRLHQSLCWIPWAGWPWWNAGCRSAQVFRCSLHC
jgi:hypothetical protein